MPGKSSNRKATSIFFHRDFEKQFLRLPKKLQRQTLERLELFLQDPRHPLLNNHPMRGDTYPACRSLNITADLRVLYTMEGTAAVCVAIDTHNHLYNHQ